MKVKSLSRVRLFVTSWTLAYQAPPSMGFSRQEYWSGLPFPSPGDLRDPGTRVSRTAGRSFTIWATREALYVYIYTYKIIYNHVIEIKHICILYKILLIYIAHNIYVIQTIWKWNIIQPLKRSKSYHLQQYGWFWRMLIGMSQTERQILYEIICTWNLK